MAKAKGISLEEARKQDVSIGDKGPVIPIGRHGTPQDAANMVEFLISDESSYITGQNILMNGGNLAY